MSSSKTLFCNLVVRPLRQDGSNEESKSGLIMELSHERQATCYLKLLNGSQECLYETVLNKSAKGFQCGDQSFIIKLHPAPLVILFPNTQDLTKFVKIFQNITSQIADKLSVFDQRTDESSASQYFQFYGYLSQQQNMMQDYIRTSTYQNAILQNSNEFKGKVVLDVGAGTGILSYFAVQAGARKVYAVEASNMAQFAKELTTTNKFGDVIEVVAGKIEEISLPEDVDIIISEPMGYMLYNERMLETYIHARKWLKPGGNMYPTRGDLYVAPFTDDALFMEHFGKSNFWCQTCFYGVNLTNLRQAAIQEYFRQPIVDTFDVRILMAKPCLHSTNFLTASETDLQTIRIPLHYTMLMTGTVHGLAFWFDVAFLGQINHIYLSTAPQEPLTHWYQVRCLLPNPVFVRAGQKVSGSVVLHANQRQSYDVEIEITLDGTGVRSSNILDLKNPFFRYTGVQSHPPPGNSSQSPTESYWNNPSIALNNGVMNASPAYSGQGSHSSGGGMSAYTSQVIGNVMATGTQQNIGTYTGPTVQIGNERYIVTNQSQSGQFDRMYISGMSG